MPKIISCVQWYNNIHARLLMNDRSRLKRLPDAILMTNKKLYEQEEWGTQMAAGTFEDCVDIVDFVVDVFATFDDRLCWHVEDPSGSRVVSFRNPGHSEESRAEVHVVRTDAEDFQLVLTTVTPRGVVRPTAVYEGPFQPEEMRNQLSHALALWYGDIIRTSVV